MGGIVTRGTDNDDLVYRLMEAKYIKTPEVEMVFRAVDRKHFILPEGENIAYSDSPWKCGNLHLSAPCIYSRVLENLELAPGMSFLNLGSGTGYLNTLVGLILGSKGTNHGVELHQDAVEYATKRVREFWRTSPAVDEYDFCRPKFVNGNCLSLRGIHQYDRVYCGAACTETHESYMKNLIKVGGILILPVSHELRRIRRTSWNTWKTEVIMNVCYASLQSTNVPEDSEVILPDRDSITLQEICRYVIRSIFRHIIAIEHPELKKRPAQVVKNRAKKRTSSHLDVPSPSDGEGAEIDSDAAVSTGTVAGSSSQLEESSKRNRTETAKSQDEESGPSSDDSFRSCDSDVSDGDSAEYLDIFKCDSGPSVVGNTEEIKTENSDSPADSELPEVNANTFTTYMKEKIQMLPLHRGLKHFINLDREL